MSSRRCSVAAERLGLRKCSGGSLLLPRTRPASVGNGWGPAFTKFCGDFGGFEGLDIEVDCGPTVRSSWTSRAPMVPGRHSDLTEPKVHLGRDAIRPPAARLRTSRRAVATPL